MTTGAPPEDRDRPQPARRPPTEAPAPGPRNPGAAPHEPTRDADFEHALRLQMAVITGE